MEGQGAGEGGREPGPARWSDVGRQRTALRGQQGRRGKAEVKEWLKSGSGEASFLCAPPVGVWLLTFVGVDSTADSPRC